MCDIVLSIRSRKWWISRIWWNGILKEAQSMVLLFQGKTVQTSEVPEACPRWEAEFESQPPWHSSFTWISDKVTYRVQLLVVLQSEFKESSEDANLPFRGNRLLWDMIRRIPKVSKPLDPIKARWHKSVKKTVYRVYYCFISFLFFSSFEIKF